MKIFKFFSFLFTGGPENLKKMYFGCSLEARPLYIYKGLETNGLNSCNGCNLRFSRLHYVWGLCFALIGWILQGGCKLEKRWLQPIWGMPQHSVIERNADYTPLFQNGPIRANDRPQIGCKWDRRKIHLYVEHMQT